MIYTHSDRGGKLLQSNWVAAVPLTSDIYCPSPNFHTSYRPRAKLHTTSTPSSGSDAVPLSVDTKQSSGDSSDACAWNDPHTLLTLGHAAWTNVHCGAEAELAFTVQTVVPSGPLLVSEVEQ